MIVQANPGFTIHTRTAEGTPAQYSVIAWELDGAAGLPIPITPAGPFKLDEEFGPFYLSDPT